MLIEGWSGALAAAPRLTWDLHRDVHLLLQYRMRVGQKDKLAVKEVLGNLGRPLGQHVQVHFDRDGFVQVLQIGAMPAEGLAPPAHLQAGQVYGARLQEVSVIGREILAHDANKADRREEKRRYEIQAKEA